MREALEMLGHVDLPLGVPVRSLNIGLQQAVEIDLLARATAAPLGGDIATTQSTNLELLQSGDAYMKSGDFARAEECFKTAFKREQANPTLDRAASRRLTVRVGLAYQNNKEIDQGDGHGAGGAAGANRDGEAEHAVGGDGDGDHQRGEEILVEPDAAELEDERQDRQEADEQRELEGDGGHPFTEDRSRS